MSDKNIVDLMVEMHERAKKQYKIPPPKHFYAFKSLLDEATKIGSATYDVESDTWNFQGFIFKAYSFPANKKTTI